MQFVESGQRFLVVRSFMGSGKTTSVMKILDSNYYRIIYTAPSHDIIEENITNSTFRNYSFLHLKGRDKVCTRKSELDVYIKSGFDLRFFCKQCGFRYTTCSYEHDIQKAYRETPNLALSHAHIQSFLPDFLETGIGDHKIRDNYDLLIIDENPIKCFINELSLSRSEVFHIRDILLRMNNTDYEPLLELVTELTLDILDYDRILSVDITEIKLIPFLERYITVVNDMNERGELETLPNGRFFNFIFEILTSRNVRRNIQHMIYYRDRYLNLSYFNRDALELGLRIMALDGTANKIVWDRLLKTDVEIFRIDDTYTKAFQLTGGRYPISSWKKFGSTAPVRLSSIIDDISKTRKRDVIVCGTKFVCKMALQLMKTKNHMFANYYNLRSKNSFWKQCDTVILACEPNPPQEKINACVTLSGWPENVWRIIYREEEMLQAIGRIRQNIEEDPMKNKREDRIVIILPSTGVDKSRNMSILLPEAELVTVKQLLGIFNSQDFTTLEHRILTLMPTNISKCCISLNMKKSLIHRIFIHCVRKGYIEETKRGQYKLTSSGFGRLPQAEKEARKTT